jgi:hypothetical protein
MVQFRAGAGDLSFLKNVQNHSGADHCCSSRPEVSNEWNDTSMLPYAFMACTKTN